MSLPQGAQARVKRLDRAWPALGLVALIWLVYAAGLDNGFHYDDTHSIVENPHIRTWSDWPRFFTDPRCFSATPRMAMYRPMLVASFALNYAVGGLDPRGYHVVSLLLHSAVTLLVYGLLRRRFGLGLSLWGAAAFGVHPVHTQTVEYISSRSELAAALGVVGAVYLYTGHSRLRWLGPGAYAAGLLCKSTAVATVPLLVVHDLVHHRGMRRLWRRQWPYWGITAAYIGVILGNGFLGRALGQHVRPYGMQLADQIKAAVLYCSLVIFPVHLSVEHAFAERAGWWQGAVLAGGLFGVAVIVAGLRAGGRTGLWGMAWVVLCSALTFLVPLNVQVSEQRLYLPSMGAIWLVAAVLRGRRASVLLRAAAGAGLVVFVALTWQRLGVWRDDLTLWSDAYARAPDSFRARSNYGLALYQAGRLEAAEKTLRAALALNPRYARTWNNLGLVLEDEGRVAEARAAYERCVFLDSTLGEARANLGRLLLHVGRAGEALLQLHRAVALNPYSVTARLDLGLALQETGDGRAARAAFEHAAEIDPQSAQAWNDLGMLLLEQGRDEEGRRALEHALQLDPEAPSAHVNLRALELRRRGVPRLKACERLAREFPGQAEVWDALGGAAAAAGDWEQAAEALERALELDPTAYRSYLRLGGVLRRAGRLDSAIAVYQRALNAGIECAPVYDALTSAYAAAGDLHGALRSCRRALALAPDDSTARRHLELLEARVRMKEDHTRTR